MANNSPAPGNVSVVSHYLRYMNANILVLLAGVFSCTIMYRLISNRDYGVIGYFGTFSLIWVAFLKFGTQHSILRLYSSYCRKNQAEQERQFYSTLVGLPMILSSLVSLMALGLLVLANRLYPFEAFYYLLILLVVSQIEVYTSLITNVIRVRELSWLASTLSVALRYLQLGFVLTIVIHFNRSAMGVYQGQLLASSVLIIFLFWWARRNFPPLSRGDWNPSLLKESLSYGLPLTLSELSMVLLAMGDRLIIKRVMDYEATGVYHIGYEAAAYVGIFFRATILTAVSPVFNRIYEHEGAEAFGRLCYKVIKILFIVAVPVSIGIAFVGEDFMMLLAGASKVESVPVFRWVGIQQALSPILLIAAYGLTLLKRSKTISVIQVSGAAINILLNLWLIPRCGIMGAVYATMICYFGIGVASLMCCPASVRTMLLPVDLVKPLGLGLLFGLLAFGTGLFGLENHLARLGAMAGLFLLSYAVPIYLLDRDLQQYIRDRLPFLNR